MDPWEDKVPGPVPTVQGCDQQRTCFVSVPVPRCGSWKALVPGPFQGPESWASVDGIHRFQPAPGATQDQGSSSLCLDPGVDLSGINTTIPSTPALPSSLPPMAPTSPAPTHPGTSGLKSEAKQAGECCQHPRHDPQQPNPLHLVPQEPQAALLQGGCCQGANGQRAVLALPASGSTGCQSFREIVQKQDLAFFTYTNP